MQTSPALVDRFGRTVDYIRLSVTDRCDFRCVYCMAEDMTFVPRAEVLSLEELYRVGAAFAALGVKKIRLTGGEPLVRHNVMHLVEQLGALDSLDELVITTNGSQLDRFAGPLQAAGVRRINISLDSLDADKFRRITRTGDLAQVLKGIDAARAAGFERIKLNTVIMKGRNEEEILDLVDFSLDKGLDISFIEEMPLGLIDDHDRALTFCSSDEVRDVISSRYSLTATTEQTGGPSRYWAVAGSDSRVGFISPHSHNFCHLCNRVRVTVEGRLLLCLGNEHSMDLRALLRDPSVDDEALQQALVKAMDLKPEKHHFDLDEQTDIVRFMNTTGG
ncbi:MAG: GTP 3',8-cyclase MoaA [Halieaceae bacterium]|jgi:cyclic pyranopterin phosphate synthase|nr:GTP 3',8-cyclase MoaA [Halieaceae bacterium]